MESDTYNKLLCAANALHHNAHAVETVGMLTDGDGDEVSLLTVDTGIYDTFRFALHSANAESNKPNKDTAADPDLSDYWLKEFVSLYNDGDYDLNKKSSLLAASQRMAINQICKMIIRQGEL